MSPSEAAGGPGIMITIMIRDDSTVMHGGRGCGRAGAAACLARVGSQIDNPSRIADVVCYSDGVTSLSKCNLKSELNTILSVVRTRTRKTEALTRTTPQPGSPPA
jgi:hypothetical protein